MDYIYLIIGLVLLLIGANYLIDSSVAIARKARVSNFIIGLTIVGMGTSMPELFVSVTSAFTGHGDVSMGNIVGSNICNILLILGLTATIFPFAIEKQQQLRDIPFCIFATLLVIFLSNDSIIPGISTNTLSRLDGIFLLVVFIGYLGYVIYNKAKNPQEAVAEAEEQATSSLVGKAGWLLWTIAIGSLVVLIAGGELFLNSSISLAHAWGMSEAVISITIIAVGTSLPELVTAVIAAYKKNPQLALGDILGSNVFNALGILGIASVVKPLQLFDIGWVDYAMMLLAAVMVYLVIFTFKKHKFDRVEGIIFLLVYIVYTLYLFFK
jgi:cation:H+ antiporter